MQRYRRDKTSCTSRSEKINTPAPTKKSELGNQYAKVGAKGVSRNSPKAMSVSPVTQANK